MRAKTSRPAARRLFGCGLTRFSSVTGLGGVFCRFAAVDECTLQADSPRATQIMMRKNPHDKLLIPEQRNDLAVDGRRNRGGTPGNEGRGAATNARPSFLRACHPIVQVSTSRTLKLLCSRHFLAHDELPKAGEWFGDDDRARPRSRGRRRLQSLQRGQRSPASPADTAPSPATGWPTARYRSPDRSRPAPSARPGRRLAARPAP